MQTAPQRKFTILDAMVLVAATALGLAWWRLLGPEGYFHYYIGHGTLLTEISTVGPGRWSVAGWWWRRLLNLPMAFYPVLVTSTLALLGLRLASPRPRFRRLARQPGFAACVAVMLAFFAKILELVGAQFVFGSLTVFLDGRLLINYFRAGNGLTFPHMCISILLAMVAVWGTLWATGGFRPEKSWIDRFGRVLGTLWIVLSLLRVFTL